MTFCLRNAVKIKDICRLVFGIMDASLKRWSQNIWFNSTVERRPDMYIFGKWSQCLRNARSFMFSVVRNIWGIFQRGRILPSGWHLFPHKMKQYFCISNFENLKKNVNDVTVNLWIQVGFTICEQSLLCRESSGIKLFYYTDIWHKNQKSFFDKLVINIQIALFFISREFV